MESYEHVPLVRALSSTIADRARESPSLPYLLDARRPRVITFAQLDEIRRARRDQIVQSGLAPGTRVGLLVGDPLTFATWFLAGIAAGLWIAPLDPSLVERADALCERASALSLAVVVSDREAPEEGRGALRWLDATTPPSGTLAVEEGESSLDVGGVVLSSSGTTGQPKVIRLGEGQLMLASSLVASHLRLDPSERGFNPLPLWHVNAEVVGLLATLMAGSSLVLDDRFHRTGFWKLIDDMEVTWINAVPAIVARLSPDDDEVVPKRIRLLRSASAPLPSTWAVTFESSTGIPVIQSYGMTEAASQICVNPIESPKMGSVGVAVGVEVRVVGEREPTSLSIGEVGRIEVRGPTVITAYESEEHAKRFDAEGWLDTGDLGYFDEDRYLFLVGRRDDVINRGGEKVYPYEIEAVLAGVAGVDAVAVVAEADDVLGQVPVAFVGVAEPRGLDADRARALVERLRDAATSSLERTRRPARIKLVAGFATLATGKIPKAALVGDGVEVLYAESFEGGAVDERAS